MRFKSETFKTLSHFFAWVSTQFGRSVQAIQCDNGREFDNSSSRSFFLTHGIQLRMSCPYTSAQNGKAERMIRTTNDIMCSLLFQASVPPHFWVEALHTATYLLNRLPSKAISAPTPHFALFGTPLPPMITFESLGALATPTSLPPHLTSLPLVRLIASS